MRPAEARDVNAMARVTATASSFVIQSTLRYFGQPHFYFSV